MSFHRKVFINCPFDPAYRTLLQPLLFTILYLDFAPLICETESSGNIRVKKIIRLIRASKYSIHDISRNETVVAGDLPRFNMPYEMGLDIGCQTFTGIRKLKGKRCLILERDQYRYQQFISDISGQDIKSHNNDPEILIRKLRDDLVQYVYILNIINLRKPFLEESTENRKNNNQEEFANSILNFR